MLDMYRQIVLLPQRAALCQSLEFLVDTRLRFPRVLPNALRNPNDRIEENGYNLKAVRGVSALMRV